MLDGRPLRSTESHYDGLERAAPGYVLGQRTGELASVATGNAELMEFFYAQTLADYVAAMLVPLGVLAVLLAIQPLAALTLLPLLLLAASVPYWLARRAAAQGQAVMAQFDWAFIRPASHAQDNERVILDVKEWFGSDLPPSRYRTSNEPSLHATA